MSNYRGLSEDDLERMEKSFIFLAKEAGLEIEQFKAAMLASVKWHRGDHQTDWRLAPYPGEVIEVLKGYLS